MSVHESSVNFQNLIRDLAEMYPFEVSEVVVTELVANSLDAGASRVSIDFDPTKKLLVVRDDGKGMDRAEFEAYHDFAAGLKQRGAGIGFAGLGAKISFNIADRVVTETKGRSLSAGSNWYLHSKKKLLWEDIQPIRLRSNGTRIEVWFRSDFTPSFSSTEEMVNLLRRHYLPLMDSKFLRLYQTLKLYSTELRFVVNGHTIKPTEITREFGLDKVKEFFPTSAGRKIGYGVLGVSPREYPLGPGICGMLLCTRGKVIKTDLFNQFPGSLGPQIIGVVEVPHFVRFLTTSKTDFVRKGRHREFEKLYDPLRQEFKDWLKALGLSTSESVATDDTLRLERELKKLIEDVPELAEFFGFRTRKDVLSAGERGAISARAEEGVETTFPVGEGRKGDKPGPVDTGDAPGEALVEDQLGNLKARPIGRAAPRGPKISFESRPDRLELAWVDGPNVVVNTGHPSYRKTRSDALGRTVRNLFAIASAIQRFLGAEAEPPDLMFIDRMMAAWGKK